MVLYIVCHGSNQQKKPINVSINKNQHRLDPSWVYLCMYSIHDVSIWCNICISMAAPWIPWIRHGNSTMDPMLVGGVPTPLKNILVSWGYYSSIPSIWVCLKMLCTPLYPMVLLIIIRFLNGYFIGNIPNIFRQTHMEKYKENGNSQYMEYTIPSLSIPSIWNYYSSIPSIWKNKKQ